MRGLARALAAICRNVACEVVMSHDRSQVAGGGEGVGGGWGGGGEGREELSKGAEGAGVGVGMGAPPAGGGYAGSAVEGGAAAGGGLRGQMSRYGSGDVKFVEEPAAAAYQHYHHQEMQHHHQQQQQQAAAAGRGSKQQPWQLYAASWDELPCAVMPPPSPDTKLTLTTWGQQSSGGPRTAPQQQQLHQASMELGPLLNSSTVGNCPATGPVKLAPAPALMYHQGQGRDPAGVAASTGGGGGVGSKMLPVQKAGGSGGGGVLKSLLSFQTSVAPSVAAGGGGGGSKTSGGAAGLAAAAGRGNAAGGTWDSSLSELGVPRGDAGGGASSAGGGKLRHPPVRAANEIRYEGGEMGGLPYPPDLLHHQQSVVKVDMALVERVLGPVKFRGTEVTEQVAAPGAAAGLVWTAAGGGVQFIECVRVSRGVVGRPGSLMLTGQVGDVLEESAKIALSWIRAHADELGLEEEPLPVGFAGSGRGAGGGEDRNGVEGGGGAGRVGGSRRDGVGDEDVPWEGSLEQLQLRMMGNSSSTISSSSGGRDGQQLLLGSAHAGNAAAAEATVVQLPATGPGYYLQPVLKHGIEGMAHHHQQQQLLSPALNWDLHVHLPAGAVAKDGPSAGITLVIAMVSLLSGRCVRGDTAMTGEVTLRGLVLPVGGVKEKLLAARAAGLKRVLVPARNMPDIMAEAKEVMEGEGGLEVMPITYMHEALAAAFEPPYLLMPRPRL